MSLIAILAAIAISRFEPTLHDELMGTAQVVAADIAYARTLSVTNNSTYTITFEPEQDRYYLEHSGSNSELDVLPVSAFRLPGDPATRHTTDLTTLPLGLSPIELLVAVQEDPIGASLLESVLDVEFGALGETTSSQATVIWLAAGGGTARRYISVRIDPVTGLADIGPFTSIPPSLSEDMETSDGPPIAPDLPNGMGGNDLGL